MIVRLHYTKMGMMKYLGHLDLIRFFERAFRRLNLPLAFTQGFHPHPKMNFGGPLSVGVASEYEIMEVELAERIDVAKLLHAFNQFSPDGLKLKDFRVIEKSQSLMAALAMIRYRVDLPDADCDLRVAWRAADAIVIRKKNKKKRWVDKDLKPFVADVVRSEDNARRWMMSIYANQDGSAKPLDVVRVLTAEQSLDIYEVTITRTGLFLKRGQHYLPLLEL